MKKKLLTALLIAGISVAALTGCGQSAVRTMGGSMTINLEPNEKLELVTWKEDSLWYLTRPMREDEVAETHTYQQRTTFGVFEGTVAIKEHKE